jgi:hypothetical protein
MRREEMVELVRKIKNCEGSEKELDDMIELLEKNVIYPEISDLIYFDDKTPEEIIDIALEYKPFQL